METPTMEPFPGQPIQTARRSSRSILAEIPLHLLTFQELTGVPQMPQVNHSISRAGGTWGLNLLLPRDNAPSPDELVISQRGRRMTWSPDVESAMPQPHRSTGKTYPDNNNTNDNSDVVGSTLRKRHMLHSSIKDSFCTSEKVPRLSPTNTSPSSTNLESLCSSTPMEIPLGIALLALSSQQLIELIQQIIMKHSVTEQEVKDLLPVPDIQHLEDRLSYLRKNIFISLPSSRLTSKTDSPAFSRVSTHLFAFKKCLIDQLQQLKNSQNWSTVLEYVLMAWTYVRTTPLWDNPPHNNYRRACFKSLTISCLDALKRGGPWPTYQLELIQTKLESMLEDCEDIKACLKHLSNLKK